MDIKTLIHLAKIGASDRSIEISSSKVASEIGISQQTAARKLKSLEELGFITREVSTRGQNLRLTNKGIEILGEMYTELSGIFGREKSDFFLCGYVTSGFGEGGYYMKMEGYKKQFREKVGFTPYPGTLNLKLKNQTDIKTRQEFSKLPGISIEGFKKDGRSFGSVKCFKAYIEGVNGAVVMPARTHHAGDTVEVISETKIRDKMDLKDGDKVCVKVNLA